MFLPLAIKIYKLVTLMPRVYTQFRRLPSLELLPQRLYNTVQYQLWELLPSFCESPSDLEKTFPELAPVLGAALNERKDLRLTVLTAIRRVVKFAQQPDSPGERVEVVSRYAKNFMPLLFNLYTAMTVDGDYDDKGVRLAILETVRVYVDLTPEDLIDRFVDSALSKSSETGTGATAEDKQARILDILCALARNAGATSIGKIMTAINPWFISTSHTLQKKSYRILEEILSRRYICLLFCLIETFQIVVRAGKCVLFARGRHRSGRIPSLRACFPFDPCVNPGMSISFGRTVHESRRDRCLYRKDSRLCYPLIGQGTHFFNT